MKSEYFVIALLVGSILLSACVAVSDFKFRRIPNQYLFVGVLYFFVIFAAMLLFLPLGHVLKGFAFSLIGFLIGGLFLYPAYKLKQVGAGDVKFMMVLGLLMGPKGVILALLLGAMVGGVWALILAWRIGGLKHLWYNMQFMAKSAYLSGFKDMGWDLRSQGAVAMPYGVALAAGAILIALQQLNLYYGYLQQTP